MELGQQHRPRNLLPVPTPRKLQPRLTAFSSVKKPREQSSEVERDPLLQQGLWVWKPTWKVLQSHGQGSSELQVNAWGQPNRTETMSTKSFCFALLTQRQPWKLLPGLDPQRISKEEGRRLQNQASEGFPGGSEVKNLLPTQETWVRSLVREAPTRHRATRPAGHNYWPVLKSPGAATTEHTCPAPEARTP